MINNIANIATTALQNASKSLEVSANNIANVQTKGQIGGNAENGVAYVARRADSTSQVEGGVRTLIREKNPGTIPVFDPSNPQANADGLIEIPNVNIAEEIVTQKFASYQADAGLKVLKAADEITGKLLDITV